MLKHILPIVVILLITLTACSKANTGGSESSADGSYRHLSMSEGLELMESDDNFILLDVRRLDEFENGHIPGAVNLPNEEIGKEEISSLPDKSQHIYVYCRSGNRSKQASKKLAKLGYENIFEFGGIIYYDGELEY